MALWARKQQPGRKLALVGSSMGGAIALNVSRREPSIVAACVLVAPMLGIAPENLPPAWQQTLLRGLAWAFPSLQALPQSNQNDPSQQYRDPVRRRECELDTLKYAGWMRLGSARACLETALMVGIGMLAAVLVGGPLGIWLFLSRPGQMFAHPLFNRVLDWSVNLVRSFPFIILMVSLVPLTRLLVGSSIGPLAAAVPLSIAAVPYFARLVEQTLREVPRGVIEAAEAMEREATCCVYQVAASLDDESIVVYEVWESVEAHQQSLSLETTQTLIGRAKPILANLERLAVFEPRSKN